MMISSKCIYPTKHGIPTTLSPKIGVPSKATIKRVNAWMIENALNIAKATGNEHCEILFKGMDVKNMSRSDVDLLNDYLWGDEDV